MELLTRVFLLWFTIYTLSVCPNDESLKSPVCRGLYHYRKLVLEPYLLPPIQHALAHPSVAPYVERVKPFVDHTIAVAKPIALRTQSEWNSRVVPQWEKRVVPQWNRHVVPQYRQHLQPHIAKLEAQVAPYVGGFQTEYERLRTAYESRVGPYVRATAISLHRWQRQARPYVVLAAHKTYDGYQHAKPYAIPILQRIQVLLLQLAHFLGEQRRQFVDPHIKKIWDRVNELGNGDTTPLAQARSSVSSSVSKTSASVSSVVHSASEAVVGSASSILPDIVSESESLLAVVPTANPVAPLKDDIPSAYSISSDASTTAGHAASSASPVTEKLASSASSIGSAASSVLSDHVVPVASVASLGSAGIPLVLDEAVPAASTTAEESVITPVPSLADQVDSLAGSLGGEAPAILSHAPASALSAVPEALSTATSTVYAVSPLIDWYIACLDFDRIPPGCGCCRLVRSLCGPCSCCR